jgi:hypothetical protein
MRFSFIMHLICFFFFYCWKVLILYKFVNIKILKINKFRKFLDQVFYRFNKIVIKSMMHVKYKN